MRRWRVLNKLVMAKEGFDVSEIIRILLKNREINTDKEIEEFLKPPSPYSLKPEHLKISLVDLEKAVKRIKKAVKNNEKIIIYGDYDTDGVCATAIIWEVLYQMGAKVMPFIPKREEGYGMKVERIDQFADEGVSLIITVDQGITAYPQVDHARKMGIDVIVTDHHLPGEKKPRAFSIIHTTALSGSGVSWFLAKNLGNPDLDLVTIGTVADMLPLTGANRAIVYHGLPKLRNTKRLGLKKLYDKAGISSESLGTYEIGFIIGPRINASGRLDDPMESLRLLLTSKEERALFLAQKIDEQNRKRQVLTEEMTIHARNLWFSQDGKSKLIFVSHTSYEEGILGLIAGKLVEEFYRPAVVIAQGEKYSRASARSINGFNIIEAIRSCSDILGSHGGHALAAGFSVETVRIEELKTRLLEIAEKNLNEEILTPVLKIDLEMDLSFVSLSLFEILKKLEPFGYGNPEPLFLSRNLIIFDAQTVGDKNQHLKLKVASLLSRTTFEAIGFGMGGFFDKLSPEEPVDIVYSLLLERWNNSSSLKLKIKDIRKSKNGEKD